MVTVAGSEQKITVGEHTHTLFGVYNCRFTVIAHSGSQKTSTLGYREVKDVVDTRLPFEENIYKLTNVVQGNPRLHCRERTRN